MPCVAADGRTHRKLLSCALARVEVVLDRDLALVGQLAVGAQSLKRTLVQA